MKNFIYGLLLILLCGCVSAGKGSKGGKVPVPKALKPVMVSVGAIAAMNPIVILLIGKDIRWGENVSDTPELRKSDRIFTKLAATYESRLTEAFIALYSLLTDAGSSADAFEHARSLLEVFKAIAFHMHGYGGVKEYIQFQIDDLVPIIDAAKTSQTFASIETLKSCVPFMSHMAPRIKFFSRCLALVEHDLTTKDGFIHEGARHCATILRDFDAWVSAVAAFATSHHCPIDLVSLVRKYCFDYFPYRQHLTRRKNRSMGAGAGSDSLTLEQRALKAAMFDEAVLEAPEWFRPPVLCYTVTQAFRAAPSRGTFAPCLQTYLDTFTSISKEQQAAMICWLDALIFPSNFEIEAKFPFWERILLVKEFFPVAAWAKSEEVMLKFFCDKRESLQQCVNPSCFSVRALSLEEGDDFCSEKCRFSFLGIVDTLGEHRKEGKGLD